MEKQVKTEYRIRNNGHWSWLEYKRVTTLLIIFKFTKWIPVPKPYYQMVYGRSLECIGSSPSMQAFVCSDSDNYDNFVKKYPDVNVYLKEVYLPEQKRLEDDAKKYWDEKEKKAKEIVYL